MKLIPTRDEALALLRKHNSDESHIRHAYAVEGAMRHFARRCGGDENLWGVVGILHDIDWEKTMDTPGRHCNLAPELLREAGVDESVVHAVQSHGWSICTDVEPANDMEKALFAIDELTGLVITAGLVRPSRSLSDLEVKSVKKKWKDKAFAKGVDREIILKGAALMGISIDELIENVILALRPIEQEIGLGADKEAA
ncbi:MAG: HDIG domain-containing protein [Synergistaceae bacterium]|nr:HDIG domain-containing protein [Synergistaceae bacterium]